jgi:hypothetical protein
MKYILILLIVFTTQFSFSQIYGEIAIDKRPIVKAIEYGVVSNYKGQIVFDIVVDEQGNVTVCKYNKVKSNVKSTPTIMKAKNRIVTELKFKAHSIYPQFHRGQIVMKAYKKEVK